MENQPQNAKATYLAWIFLIIGLAILGYGWVGGTSGNGEIWGLFILAPAIVVASIFLVGSYVLFKKSATVTQSKSSNCASLIGLAAITFIICLILFYILMFSWFALRY